MIAHAFALLLVVLVTLGYKCIGLLFRQAIGLLAAALGTLGQDI